MYAAGYGIEPWRASRTGGFHLGRRVVLVIGTLVLATFGLAVAAHGGTAPRYSEVVVQPGDTLWSIAAGHYPGDDVRNRVQEIEEANGLRTPRIEAGQTLRLPG